MYKRPLTSYTKFYNKSQKGYINFVKLKKDAGFAHFKP